MSPGHAQSAPAECLTQSQRCRSWPAAKAKTNSNSCQQFPDDVIPLNIKTIVMGASRLTPQASLFAIFPDRVERGSQRFRSWFCNEPGLLVDDEFQRSARIGARDNWFR